MADSDLKIVTYGDWLCWDQNGERVQLTPEEEKELNEAMQNLGEQALRIKALHPTPIER